MQTAMWFECKKIISSDVLALMRKQQQAQHKPLFIDGIETNLNFLVTLRLCVIIIFS